MSKKTILYVEDEIELADLVKAALDEANFSVQLAHDGFTAIQKCRLQKYDFIITDLNIPKIDGEDFIGLLDGNKFNQKTPIIVISGIINPTNLNAMKGKVSKVFTKPFEMNALIDFLEKF